MVVNYTKSTRSTARFLFALRIQSSVERRKYLLCFFLILKRGNSSKNCFIRSSWRPSGGEWGRKLSLSIKHKPLVGKQMSLAECCEDQLTIPCVKTKQIPKGSFHCEGFCCFSGVHVQKLVQTLLLTINHRGSAKTEKLPETAWSNGEKVHQLYAFQLLEL